MRNAQCRTWKLTRKLKNVENETQTLYDLEYSEKHSKTWEIRNVHCWTRNMARNNKKLENEKHTVGHGVWQKTEKHGQRDTNSV